MNMKGMKWVLAAGILFFCQAVYSEIPGTDGLDREAVSAFLQRIVGDKAARFEIGYIAPEKGKDVFEVGAAPGGSGKIMLRGSNGVSVASALNYYLKEY